MIRRSIWEKTLKIQLSMIYYEITPILFKKTLQNAKIFKKLSSVLFEIKAYQDTSDRKIKFKNTFQFFL